MPTLHELQTAFKRSLRGEPDALASYIAGKKPEKIFQRIAIYQKAYRQRYLDILNIDFPVLLALIGEQPFQELANSYVNQLVSEEPSVALISKGFPGFLSEKNQAYSELALFEYLIEDTLDAADAKVLTLEMLQALAKDNLADQVFSLHPSVRLFTEHCHATDLWRDFHEGKPLQKLSLTDTSRTWLLWRANQLDNHHVKLEPNQAFMLAVLNANKTFAEICESLTEYLPDDQIAAFVVLQLQAWAQDQILILN